MADKEREVALIIATGRKGVGKTYKTLRLLDEYRKPNPDTGKYPRKVLIFDANLEYTPTNLRLFGMPHLQIKALRLEDIPRFNDQKTIEVRRILPYDEKGRLLDLAGMKETMIRILDDPKYAFRNGLVLLEDLNKYETYAKSSAVVSVLATTRQRGLDMIVHLQSMKAITDRLWANTTYIRQHAQMDDVTKYENKIPNYEIFKIAQCIINRKYFEGNKRYCLWISNEDLFIKGGGDYPFTQDDFMQGCLDYIDEEPAMLQKHKYKYGGKINEHTLPSIKKDIIKELLAKYYK